MAKTISVAGFDGLVDLLQPCCEGDDFAYLVEGGIEPRSRYGVEMALDGHEGYFLLWIDETKVGDGLLERNVGVVFTCGRHRVWFGFCVDGVGPGDHRVGCSAEVGVPSTMQVLVGDDSRCLHASAAIRLALPNNSTYIEGVADSATMARSAAKVGCSGSA